MSRTLTASAGTVTPMWRRSATGELVQVEPQPNEYGTPPKGTRGRFVLSGISDTFEMTGQFGATTNVRVEYLIEKVADAGRSDLNGKRFTQLFTWKVGPKSNLGQLLAALRGRDIQPGEEIDPDTFIGTSFVSSTTLSENGDRQYAGVSVEAIDPTKTKLSPYVTGGDAAAQPELVGVAVGGGEDLEDPFTENDDL